MLILSLVKYGDRNEQQSLKYRKCTHHESESVSHSAMSDSFQSLPGSSAHEILQARILEWVAVPFSRGSDQPRDRTSVSCIVSGLNHWNCQGSPTFIKQQLSSSPIALYWPWCLSFYFYIYEFFYLKYLALVESWNICLFVAGLFSFS